MINDDRDSASFSAESQRIEIKLVLLDKCDGKKVVEDLNWGCNFSVEDYVRNDDRGNGSTDNRERYVHSTDYSDGDCDGDVTEEI